MGHPFCTCRYTWKWKRWGCFKICENSKFQSEWIKLSKRLRGPKGTELARCQIRRIWLKQSNSWRLLLRLKKVSLCNEKGNSMFSMHHNDVTHFGMYICYRCNGMLKSHWYVVIVYSWLWPWSARGAHWLPRETRWAGWPAGWTRSNTPGKRHPPPLHHKN